MLMENTARPTACIVGAGLGGLATSVRLAAQGFRVTVFESGPSAGGKATWFEQAGYTFDAGPSLFTLPELVDDLFAVAGEDPAAFEYAEESIACRYFWNDGLHFEAPAEPKQFAQAASEIFGEDAGRVLKYLDEAAHAYQHFGKVFLENPLNEFSTWTNLRTLKLAKEIFRVDLLGTMDSHNRRAFNNPKLVQLFNRFATYNGSDPYRAPGLLTMIPHLEHGVGSFFPKGGIRAIPRVLQQLAEKMGVEFHFNKTVEQIEVAERAAKGVLVDGVSHSFDLIVSNMDVVPTYRRLLPNQPAPEKTLSQERSSSALIFYWGIAKEFSKLGLHNIFFADDYRAEFDGLFSSKAPSPDPTVYIHISSKCEATDAPYGKENWFVMINAPHDANVNWDDYKARAREAILKKLSERLGDDVESLIETEATLSPPEIEAKTHSYRGALYGAASNNKFAAFLRHPNRTSRIDRLLFVGGSVHPGGGIPLVLLSAKIAADAAKKYFITK